jgi:hypothetical protein
MSTDPGQALLDYIASRSDACLADNFNIERPHAADIRNSIGLRGHVFAYRDSLIVIPQFAGWEYNAADGTYTKDDATVEKVERGGWRIVITVGDKEWICRDRNLEVVIQEADAMFLRLAPPVEAPPVEAPPSLGDTPSGYGPLVPYTAAVRPAWLVDGEAIFAVLRNGETRDYKNGLVYDSAWSCQGTERYDLVAFARSEGRAVVIPWSPGDEPVVLGRKAITLYYRSGARNVVYGASHWGNNNGRGDGGLVGYSVGK